jgi:D-alanyl-D-alanine carboxypeptidase
MATVLGACSTTSAAGDTRAPTAATSVAPAAPTTTTTPASPTTTTSTISPRATTTTTATTTSTTIAAESGPATSAASSGHRLDPATPFLNAAFDALVGGNDAVSVTVLRGGEPVFRRASGSTNGGDPVTSDTPLVLASVSKLVTALSIARLVESGDLALDDDVPWDELGIAHDPAWDDVTVQELLLHSSGMPVARESWLNEPGSCAIPLANALAAPPRGHRGRWTYSNGNYCALGLLVEHVTGRPIDDAVYELVFEPARITGPHLTTDGPQLDDGPYREGLARFDRLGGAGNWVASTDDIATMLTTVTTADRDALMWPGVIVDQYGWGHTGTVDGAKACAWVLDGGYTIVVAVVAGNRPATGGKVCDAVVPALAADLGIWADDPVRSPA